MFNYKKAIGLIALVALLGGVFFANEADAGSNRGVNGLCLPGFTEDAFGNCVPVNNPPSNGS